MSTRRYPEGPGTAPRTAPAPALPTVTATDVPAVRCAGLTYAFGASRAVDGLDLMVRPGEVFGLLGPNGAGKTTTMRVITTLLPVPPGVVEVFGKDVARHRMAVRRLLGYVPQQLSADASLTGRENVRLFARVFDVPRRERAARVSQALDAVGLGEVAHRLAATYSGGMVRRLELAQALVSAPRLMILDEPTIGLDPIARDGVWDRITEIRAGTGMTVLVTTHSMDEADRRCDRLALMHLGRLRAFGTPAELKGELVARRRESGATDLPPPTLEDVFRYHSGSGLDDPASATENDGDDRDSRGGRGDRNQGHRRKGRNERRGAFGDVRRTRRTASRLG
ncbi:ATP-binding cassette domain-containing protein [Streptomyces sp. NPDC014734]|uniref:ABC transporter ATP-binding protein n=1 Tax=Streptomyces sp. NPDC014734 TaxID=3364886 RepID=UPI00370135B0